MEQDCLFCKIVNKTIESKFIYENDNVVAFKDINPQATTHLLIVPKKHIRSVNDLTDKDKEIVAQMIFAAKDIAKQQSINETGYKLLFNVEKGGGQVIFHIHLHLIAGWKKENWKNN